MYDIFYLQLIFGFILLGGVFARHLFKKKRQEKTNVKNDVILIIIAITSLIILDVLIYVII